MGKPLRQTVYGNPTVPYLGPHQVPSNEGSRWPGRGAGCTGTASSHSLCPHRPPGPSSKFRHAQGSILHRDSHISNLKGLNLTTPGESDGFCANRLRVAVPLLSSGGQVAVLEVRALPHQGYPD